MFRVLLLIVEKFTPINQKTYYAIKIPEKNLWKSPDGVI